MYIPYPIGCRSAECKCGLTQFHNYSYASTSGSAFSWSYDSSRLAATNRRELVSGMSSAGHITRTLLVPSRHADLLLISRGSNSNLDAGTTSLASGRSMIKVFNTTAIGTGKPADYTRDGVVLGWGLRNSVGVAENPADGGIWSVENSADQVTRYGVDFHRDNPGEELNYHGGLDGIPEEAANYGYVCVPGLNVCGTVTNCTSLNCIQPSCVAVYDPTAIPRAGSLSIGSQFALAPNETFTDATCNSDLFRSPRLTFAAHTAPLSLAFNGSTSAFVAFHGSWNRDDPVGYHVAVLDFSDDGQPRKTSGEKDPETRVMWNEDLGSCPDACFRPAGVAVGREGQVFVTADSTGDLWVLTRERESATGRDQSAVSKRCTARSEVVLAVVLGMAVWNGLL